MVVQQPGSVEANCFRSYRPIGVSINPCPIFLLLRRNADGTVQSIQRNLEDFNLFIAHAVILSETGKDLSWINIESLERDPKDKIYLKQLGASHGEQIHHGQVPTKAVSLLCGNIVSSCHILTDLKGDLGAYFIFEDLSVNMEGRYRLKISVSDLSM